MQKEKIIMTAESIGIVIILNYCFYRHIAAFFLLTPIGMAFYHLEKKELICQKKEKFRQQFKDMLLLTVAGQRAGYSVENAFFESYEDLCVLYGKQSDICAVLSRLKIGFVNHIPLQKIWNKIGEESEIEEIKEFAKVFAIAKESSGNMTHIMEHTARIIETKVETKKEIETILSARKLEQKIMNVVPFVLMIYIDVTSPGYFDRMYQSIAGRIVMSVCLLVYLFAYKMGVRITHIYV